MWDQIIDNVNDGRTDKTLPETSRALCNLTQLPLGSGSDRFHLKQWKSEYIGRICNFDSEISKWCFDIEPDRYAGRFPPRCRADRRFQSK